jgi:hypothetical protein
MKLASIQRALTEPSLYLGRHRHILLLSHMRCYTSLLGHIFGNNPEVAGFSELHMPYCSERDLLRARRMTSDLVGARSRSKRIYFDKLLHNKYYVGREIMKMPNVDIIVSMRRPQDAIASIVNMGQKYHDPGWYQDQFRVVNYYTARLTVCCEFIETYIKWTDRRPIFIEAEKLIEYTDQTLRVLSKELSLTSPLSERYETFDATGQPGVGDPSATIKAGRIMRNLESNREVRVDSRFKNWAEDVYSYSLEAARRSCVII